MKKHLRKFWYWYLAAVLATAPAFGLTPINNGDAMSTVRATLNKLIARYNPTNLSGGTTIATNTAYYDTLSANRTLAAISGTPAEGDWIHVKFNVTGATRTLNLHTNNTVYRVGDSGPLAAAIDFPIGTHWLTLEYANTRWELVDSGVDDETANYIYAAPDGSAGTPAFRELVDDDIPNAATITTATAVKSSAYTAGTDDPREVYGGVIYVTGAATITLPAVAAGMSVTIIANGANAVTVDPNASDLIIRDGTSQADGVTIVSPGATGDIVTLTYYSADGWFATSNTWTQGS